MHLHQLKWLVVLITLSTLCQVTDAAADQSGPSWTALMMSGKRLHDPSYFLKAVAVAEQSGEDDPRVHMALEVAAFEHRVPAPRIAESLFKKDIRVLERLDVDFPEIARDCFELSKLLNGQGRYAESQAFLTRALAIRDKWQDYSSNEPYTAEIIAALFMAYEGQGKTALANECYAKMLTAVNQLRSEVTRARCLDALQEEFAHYVSVNPRLTPDQAKHFLIIARDLCKQSTLHYHTVSDRAKQLTCSGLIELDLREQDKAWQFFRQSLDLAETDLAENPETASSDYACLAAILFNRNRLDEIDRLQRRWLSQWARISGITSERYARVLSEFTGFWTNNARPDLAVKLRREVGAPKQSPGTH
jgi:tetratricopeptide (TPR) repeat protein